MIAVLLVAQVGDHHLPEKFRVLPGQEEAQLVTGILRVPGALLVILGPQEGDPAAIGSTGSAHCRCCRTPARRADQEAATPVETGVSSLTMPRR